ncbi:MAG: hypothetical protein FH758_14870 [Firmicutes bacterium]|nr:hypothetical protein [Bacillota bacterium]
MNLRIKKFGIIAIGCMMLLIAVVGCNAGKELAAEVNGEEITMEEYNERVASVKGSYESMGVDFESEQGKEMEETLKQNVLDDMIDQVLIRQQAEEEGVEPTEEDVNKRIEEVKGRFETEEQYQQALKDNEVSEEQLRDDIYSETATNNLFEKVTADVKEIDEKQVEEYYQQNKESEYSSPKQLKTRHILFFVNEEDREDIPVKRSDEEAKSLAQEVIDQLNQGVDFAELAKEKSEDTGTKDNGGLFAFEPAAGRTDPQFAVAAEALAEGEYTSEPVRSQFGYHVIKLEEVIPAETQPYSEVKENIQEKLNQEAKTKHFTSYIKEIREKADIKKHTNA